MKNLNRFKFLQIAVCFGFLVGIIFSYELWFPLVRTFPRVPILFSLPNDFIVSFERFFSVILIASLIATIFFRNRRKIFFITAIGSLIILIFFDQMRLQPWVYQYLLLLVVFASNERHTENETNPAQTLGLVQIIIAGLYFWGGLQKLNFSFAHETLPILLTPLQNIFPTFEPPLIFFGLTIAIIEIIIGCGLLWTKTQNTAVCLAVVMHIFILCLLIAADYNSIVWVWNTTLIFLVFIAFWQSDVSFGNIFSSAKLTDRKNIPTKTIVTASVLLPILSFFGLWDMYLSGALYSGNSEIGVILLNEDIFAKLPQKAKQIVFKTKTDNTKILPLIEWSINELNVPVYPERRVFKQISREVCKLPNDKNKIELIIKERPSILDGEFTVKRISCNKLYNY